MSTTMKQLAQSLLDFANHPAESGYVPIGPSTLREIAAMLSPEASGDRLLAVSVVPLSRTRDVLSVHLNRAVSIEEMNAFHRYMMFFQIPRPGPYRVVQDRAERGCKECGHGAYWTIVTGKDEHEIAIGQSWADKELADDVCDHMNMAAEEAVEAYVRSNSHKV